MTEEKFILFITDKDGNSFYEENNTVQLQGQPRQLSKMPDGLNDIAIKYQRDNKFFGIFRSWSFPLGFVKDGRNILKHIYHKLGVEFKAFALFYILDFFIDDNNYSFGYKPYYKGEIDFSTYVQDEHRIEVSLMDGGLESIINAKENTVYEIPLQGQRNVALMDGLNLMNTVQFVITDGFINDEYPYNRSHLVELMEVSKEVNEIGGTKSVSRFKIRNNSADIKATGSWFMTATSDKQATFEYDFILSRSYVIPISTLGMTLRVVIRAISKDGSNIRQITLLEINNPVQIIGSTRIHGTSSMELMEGDEVFLYTMVDPQGEGANTDVSINFNYSGEGLFKVAYAYKHPQTYALGMHPGTLFKALIEKASDGKYTADTTYLDTLKEYFLTSGDALRTVEDAKIKTSIAEFWQWISSRLDVHLSVVNNKAYIGDMRFLYQTPTVLPFGSISMTNFLDQAIDIGEVKSLKIKPATDYMFSSITAGYQKQNYEDVNGRSETNQGQYWTPPVNRVNRTLDLVSPYRADPYGIEYVRINFGNKKTTDAASDNETFVLHIERNPFFQIGTEDNPASAFRLDRSANAYVSGVMEPTQLFNIQLSPKHNLLKKGRFIRSCIDDKLDAEKIKFQSADRNSDMVVNYPSGTVRENEDITIYNLGERYFLPQLIEFETYKPINLVEIINGGNLKKHCIKFTWEGKMYFGFIQDIGIKPSDNEVQTYTLISSPKNDLSKI